MSADFLLRPFWLERIYTVGIAFLAAAAIGFGALLFRSTR